MKKILLIGTGGTIASKPGTAGLEPALTADELMRFVPKAESVCNVTCKQIMNIDSTNMGPSNWLKIAAEIEQAYAQYDGFVVCHGTDTLAYTAAALSYLIQKAAKPIVITGAQRPIDEDVTDARMNLYNSLLYASSDTARDVSIVFNGKVIAGTRGRKVKTKSYDAFASINFPYLASVQDGMVIPYRNDAQITDNCQTVFSHSLEPAVTVLKLIPSMHADVLAYLSQQNVAVIIESFGVGGIPNEDNRQFHNAIRQWVEQGKTVVMATQVAEEGSHMSTYQVGNTIKKEFHLLESYDMTLEAALTKMMWIRAKTSDPKEIRRLFYQTVNFDTLYRE